MSGRCSFQWSMYGEGISCIPHPPHAQFHLVSLYLNVMYRQATGQFGFELNTIAAQQQHAQCTHTEGTKNAKTNHGKRE